MAAYVVIGKKVTNESMMKNPEDNLFTETDVQGLKSLKNVNASRQRSAAKLLHQQDRPAALDFTRDLSMHVGGHAGNATRQNLAALRNKFLQKIRILIIDRLHCDIDSAPRHGPIGAAKCRTTFWSFRLHGWLPCLAVQSALPQKRIVFFLL